MNGDDKLFLIGGLWFGVLILTGHSLPILVAATVVSVAVLFSDRERP
jgi:hypothetical protein